MLSNWMNLKYVRILFKKSIDYFDTTFYSVPCYFMNIYYKENGEYGEILWGICFRSIGEKDYFFFLLFGRLLLVDAVRLIIWYLSMHECDAAVPWDGRLYVRSVHTTLSCSLREILFYLVGKFNEKFIIIIFSILKIMIFFCEMDRF